MRARASSGNVEDMLRSHVRDVLLARVPVTERRLDLAGAATAILEGGDGAPLLLLHGPGGNATDWMRVIPALVTRNRVIAPDLPGHGASERADDPLAWLDALIAETCPAAPTLVGHAVGGALAAHFAAAHADRIHRLVLVDALGLVPFDPAPKFGRALGDYVAEPTRATHDRLWEHCAFDLPRLQQAMGADWEPFAAYHLDTPSTPDLMERFGLAAIDDPGRIGVPVALIWGRHDLATPLAAAEAACARYGWPLHVVEACGDDPAIEQPEALVRALAIEAGREQLQGAVLLPGAPGFEDATGLWNGAIATTPAVVVQPAGTADVVAAVELARELGVPVSVRGGGHNIAGTALANGGVTIDLSARREVVVDPVARTATVEPGCLLGDVDRATQAHGLATPLGFFSEVGVAGLTLGGGLGYLSRRFGWTVDNLLAVEIVTADGCVRRASRDEQADLFWAVRGGGTNMGVVTSFTYRLHEVGPTVYGGLIAWPFERAEEVLDVYRAITSAAPRELAVFMIGVRAPAAPFVPPEWHGRRICAMSVCYSGDLEAAETAVAPLRALGDPVVDLLHEQPYTELQSYLDATEPKGRHYYWRTEYAATLSDGLLATWRDVFGACPIPDAELGFLHLGGAIADREGDDGAVGNRDAAYAVGIIGMWDPDDTHGDDYCRWVQDAAPRFAPFATGGNYVNFQTADEDDARVRAAYGANYERLAAIKRRYDPANLFRSNRNIRP